MSDTTPVERLQEVRAGIARAAADYGRDPASVTLVAVSKTFPAEDMEPILAAGQRMMPALVASLGAAVVAVVVRLVQRTPVTQAFSGLLGVVIGVVWAWRSGQAQDYFLYGLWVNVAYGVGTLATILAGFPLVGLVVGLFDREGPLSGGSWSRVVAWRADPALRRRYALATWPWVAMFVLRLVVQVPLYRSAEVAWLGTAKLAMGLPLTALVLWLSWRLVRRSAASPASPPTRPVP